MANATIIKNSCKVDPLYQWDTDQKLVIYGLSLSVTPEIHFSRAGDEEAAVCRAVMDPAGVIRTEVPDHLLERPGEFYAYVCIKEAGTFSTLFKIAVPVLHREKPCDCLGGNEVRMSD